MNSATRRIPEISFAEYKSMTEEQREAHRLSVCHEMVDRGYAIDLGDGQFQRTAKQAPWYKQWARIFREDDENI
jgi:hypothetical protein